MGTRFLWVATASRRQHGELLAGRAAGLWQIHINNPFEFARSCILMQLRLLLRLQSWEFPVLLVHCAVTVVLSVTDSLSLWQKQYSVLARCECIASVGRLCKCNRHCNVTGTRYLYCSTSCTDLLPWIQVPWRQQFATNDGKLATAAFRLGALELASIFTNFSLHMAAPQHHDLCAFDCAAWVTWIVLSYRITFKMIEVGIAFHFEVGTSQNQDKRYGNIFNPWYRQKGIKSYTPYMAFSQANQQEST